MRSTSTPDRQSQQRSAKRSPAATENGAANGQHSDATTDSGQTAASINHDRPVLLPGGDVEFAPARSGDHVLIFSLLQHIFHAPTVAEFQASQDAPLYEPSDRLVARYHQRLLGHVQTVSRVMQFDSLRLPTAEIRHLGVLPEFRGQGIGGALLQAAERKIVDEGGQLAVLRTSEPHFFARRGWVLCSRHCYSTATARDILAQLADRQSPKKSPLVPQRQPVNIRLWRQIEQDDIAEIYQNNAHRCRGSIERNHAYWRWLVSRHAYDRIYVAVEGNERNESDGPPAQIVGYAAVQDARILELQALPGHATAARQLLARACGDAIERGENSVRLNAPPHHPLHQVMRQAGGRYTCSDVEQGEVLMAKLFDPQHLLQQLRGDIFARARDSELSLPLELGLCIDGEKQQVVISRRSAKLVEGKLGRSYLTCSRRVFCRLLLGDLEIANAEATGLLQVSTRVAGEIARVLFPPQPIWHSPLDHSPAE